VKPASRVIVISLSTAEVDDVELAPFFLIEPFGPAVLLSKLEVQWLVIEDETIDGLDATAFPELVVPGEGYEVSSSPRMSAAVTNPLVPCTF
jgi:hypothetical protein